MSKTNKIHIDWELGKAELAVVITSAVVVCFAIFFTIMAYTPLHNIIPGYPTASVRLQQVETAIRIDSLERSIRRWEIYSENLRNVIAGEKPMDIETIIGKAAAPDEQLDAITLDKTDSTLRAEVTEYERFDVSDRNKRNLQIEGIHFFKPINGTVSKSFDNALHPYIDITAPEGSTVKAALDGSVIYSEWTETYGWSIIIQHDNGILSIYRHNQKLLKNVADRVSAGTSIGLLGGSSLAEDCHLQFELWQDGTPVDPTVYINF